MALDFGDFLGNLGEVSNAVVPQVVSGYQAGEQAAQNQAMTLAKLQEIDRKAMDDAFEFQKKQRQGPLEDILLAQKVNIPEPVATDEDLFAVKAEILGDPAATEATPDQMKQIDARLKQVVRSKVPSFDPYAPENWMKHAADNMVSNYTAETEKEERAIEMQAQRLAAQDARFAAGQENLMRRLGITLKETALRQEDAQNFTANQKNIDRTLKQQAQREAKAQKIIQQLNKEQGAYFNFNNPNFKKGRERLIDAANQLKALNAPDSWAQFQGDYGHKLKAMVAKEKVVRGGQRKPNSEVERFDQREAEREADQAEGQVKSIEGRERAELLLLEDQAKVANGAFLSRRDAERLDQLRAKHGSVKGPKTYQPGRKYKDGDQFLFQGQLMRVKNGRAIPVR